MDFLPQCYAALSAYKQFILYKIVPSNKRVGKFDKFPVHPITLKVHNAHDSEIWLTASEAIKLRSLNTTLGVGFVFTANDPFFFVDIDNCYNPDAQQWSELCMSLTAAFPNAAIEVSASHRGIHIIGSGVAPAHSCKNVALGLELYTQCRFVALTGLNASGDAGVDFSYVLPWLVEHYFPVSKEPENSNAIGWTDTPRADWSGPGDDAELIRRACLSKSGASLFGTKARFVELWEADEQALSVAFPCDDRAYDESSADAALAQHLAFWTGCDAERMQRLMMQSKLCREKYEREDYLPRTILNALGRQKDILQDSPPETLTTATIEEKSTTTDKTRLAARKDTPFLSPEQQVHYFKNCVYVTDENRIFVPRGDLLNQDRFNVAFGGYKFIVTPDGAKPASKPWECFTNSNLLQFPQVDTACFRPDLAPGAIVDSHGRTAVNIYVPQITPCQYGDVTLFLEHINKLLPRVADQEILLAYMAAIVQHKGVKFQWSPILQGVEGNGKTLLTSCLLAAIGYRYSHMPKAAELSSKFNDWLYGRILVGVEDIYIQAGREEVYESVKPMITGKFLEIEPKGGVKTSREVCANFMINTNHKDGLRKTGNDRRFAMFYTAQQEKGDLLECGMGAKYFRILYDFLEKQNGFSHVHYFLLNYQIPDALNPALGSVAPETSSTYEAIAYGLGPVEQCLFEAVEEGRTGFKGGMMSSAAIEDLLRDQGYAKRIPINKRLALVKSLGYDRHTGLKDGRTNDPVKPWGRKVVIYIQDNHNLFDLKGAAVAKAYEDAQRL